MRITLDLTQNQIDSLMGQLSMKEESPTTVLRSKLLEDILRETSVLPQNSSTIPVRLAELKTRVNLSGMSNVEFGRHLSAISDRIQEKRVFEKKHDHVGTYYLIGNKGSDSEAEIIL